MLRWLKFWPMNGNKKRWRRSKSIPMFEFWLQQFINTLQLLSFYLPLSVAFAMIQAITRRIFLSFGDLAMFGSFAAIYVCFASELNGDSDLIAGLWSLAAAIACGGALGAVIAKVFMGKKLLDYPLAFMIASIGLSIFIEEIMRIQSAGRDIWVPPLFSGLSIFELHGQYLVKLSGITFMAILVGVGSVVGVGLLLKLTRFGLHWRACAQSLKLTALCGINPEVIAHQSFGIAGALAGVTGWASAISYGGASFSIGIMIGFKAMFASVIGGFGTIRGAVIGACVLAFLEVGWSTVFGTTYRDVAVFSIIVLCLILRPEGLAGIGHERESEAQ